MCIDSNCNVLRKFVRKKKTVGNQYYTMFTPQYRRFEKPIDPSMVLSSGDLIADTAVFVATPLAFYNPLFSLLEAEESFTQPHNSHPTSSSDDGVYILKKNKISPMSWAAKLRNLVEKSSLPPPLSLFPRLLLMGLNYPSL